jgi:hypothetical protein
MKKRVMAIVLMMMPGFASAAIVIPDPVSSVPHDSIFRGSLTCTLSCADDSATIYYTTDGTNPTTVSPFSPPGWYFEFDSTVTLKVRAIRSIDTRVFYSNTISVKYTNKLGAPFIDPRPSSTFTDSIIIRLTRPESGAVSHYTLDGTIPDSTSTIYTLPIVRKETTTIKYMATKPKCIQSDILSGTYEKVNVSVNGRQIALQEYRTLKVIASDRSKSNMVLNFTLTHPENVVITMNDFSGRPIATLVNKYYEKGMHEFSWDTRNTPAGFYLLKMKISTETLVKRISLVR